MLKNCAGSLDFYQRFRLAGAGQIHVRTGLILCL
jgi:hypothetical protein